MFPSNRHLENKHLFYCVLIGSAHNPVKFLKNLVHIKEEACHIKLIILILRIQKFILELDIIKLSIL